MNEKEVIIQGEFPLSGTLTIPKIERDTYPAILILSGSGKGDRDGNFNKLNLNIYKDLAEFLTENGFITLRYDKRGTHKSGGNYFETGLKELIDDAIFALQYLQNVEQVDRKKVFILGHSEGALIAPAILQKVNVSGLILLAGAARSSKELSEIQIEKLSADMKEATGLKGALLRLFKADEKLKKQNKKVIAKIMNSNQPVMRIKGARMNAKWVRETYDYDVCKYLKEVTCPVLAVSGGKDVQVPPKDAKRIAELVQGDSEWHVIENMNHILRKFDGEHSMLNLMKEYKRQVGQLIDQELLNILKTWINKYTNY